MHRIIKIVPLLMAFSFLGNNRANGQTSKGMSEVSICTGVVSTDQIFDVLKDVIVDVFTLGYTPERTNYTFKGPYFATYRFYITNGFSVGGTIGLDYNTGDFVHQNNKIGAYRRDNMTGACELSLNYLNNKIVRLYGYLGIGMTFAKETDGYDPPNNKLNGIYHSTHLNGQITPIGLRIGNEMVGAFVELGFGYKGIADIGISVNFPTKHIASKQPQGNP